MRWSEGAGCDGPVRRSGGPMVGTVRPLYLRTEPSHIRPVAPSHRTANYFKVNVISIWTATLEGWPPRVPGFHVHNFSALTAS